MYINLTNVSKDYIPSGEKHQKQHTAEKLFYKKGTWIQLQKDCNFFQGDANGNIATFISFRSRCRQLNDHSLFWSSYSNDCLNTDVIVTSNKR